MKQKQLSELNFQASKEKEIEEMIHKMELRKKEKKAKLVLVSEYLDHIRKII